MKNCINCGAPIEDSAKFCPECGTKQPVEYRCKSCGTVIDPNVKFCPECGAKQGVAEAPQQAPAPAPAQKLSREEIVNRANDLFYGSGAEEELREAFSLFKQAAELGDVDAGAMCGYMYLEGYGVERNVMEAGRLLRMAADKGSSRAFDDIKEAGFELDYTWSREALKWLSDKAEKNTNYNWAYVVLGDAYLYIAKEGFDTGEGDDNKPKELTDDEKVYALDQAEKWFKKALEKNPNNFVAKNKLSAVEHAKNLLNKNNQKPSGQPNTTSQPNTSNQPITQEEINILDNIYGWNEDGSPRAVTQEAFDWFKKSAAKGSAKGQYLLGRCYYFGDIVEVNDAMAYKWFRLSANQGYSESQFRLGECYYKGYGVEKDYCEAVNWFRKSADQGNSAGEYYLGECYYLGHGVAENNDKAFKLFTSAANKDYVSAQTNLGECYYRGYGTEINYSEAVKWFLKAANGGNARSQYYLGECYYYGRGVGADRKKSLDWYKQSAAKGYEDAKKKIEELF